MVSALDRAKRALVVILRTFGHVYGLVVDVTRDSPDSDISRSYRQVSRKTHPDHGGNTEHQKSLNIAHDDWNVAKRSTKQAGRPKATERSATAADDQFVIQVNRVKEYRFQSLGVLLTYQKFADKSCWKRFLLFVTRRLCKWKVRYWCATLETNGDETYHLHLMLQFFRAQDRSAPEFEFEDIIPNGHPNDLLGEGWGGKRQQVSLDRGFFYCWADKLGTARVRGEQCVAGNYTPAWTGDKQTYPVKGEWLDRLLKAYKLSFDTYESYLYLARDGVPSRKRNLEACREKAEELALKKEVEARAKKIRDDPTIFQPFATVPQVLPWLECFSIDAMRFPILVVLAPSYSGKTEWARSLFKKPLVLRMGNLPHFPEKMRCFNRNVHDALILDDVRDIQFLSEHQEKLQGNYEDLVEFGTTTGGTCAFLRDLWKVPVVVTVNNDTRNLDFLLTHDWLGKRQNVCFMRFAGRPG